MFHFYNIAVSGFTFKHFADYFLFKINDSDVGGDVDNVGLVRCDHSKFIMIYFVSDGNCYHPDTVFLQHFRTFP